MYRVAAGKLQRRKTNLQNYYYYDHHRIEPCGETPRVVADCWRKTRRLHVGKSLPDRQPHITRKVYYVLVRVQLSHGTTVSGNGRPRPRGPRTYPGRQLLPWRRGEVGTRAAACVRSGGRPAGRPRSAKRCAPDLSFNSFSRRLAAAADDRVQVTLIAACRRRFFASHSFVTRPTTILLQHYLLVYSRPTIRIDSPCLCACTYLLPPRHVVVSATAPKIRHRSVSDRRCRSGAVPPRPVFVADQIFVYRVQFVQSEYLPPEYIK